MKHYRIHHNYKFTMKFTSFLEICTSKLMTNFISSIAHATIDYSEPEMTAHFLMLPLIRIN